MARNGLVSCWSPLVATLVLGLVGLDAAAQAPARPGTPTTKTAPRPAGPAAPITAQARPATPATARPAVPAGAAAAGSATATPKTNTGPAQVMAVVNGEQITRADLGRECIRRYGEEVLESLVNRQLIIEACQARGVQITEKDVSDEIDRIAARFGLDRARWLSLLQQERGFGEAQYKREVVWPMLALRRLAADNVAVSQEELKKAFDTEFGPRVRARLIAVTSKAKADEARAKAIANPASFGELSKDYSEEPGVASSYGVIPPIRKHIGDANLERAAFSLKPGQISEIVQVANMYYILKCEEQIQGQLIASQHLAEQQKRMEEKIRENKMRIAAAKMMEQVEKAAQIEIIFTDIEKSKAMPGVAALVNGQQISLAQLADECITRHGEEVLDGEINRKILTQELAKKKQVIEKQDIDTEVARAADAYGFQTTDGKPDVERWLKNITSQEGATVDLYVRDAVWPSVALKKLVGAKVAITEQDLQKGYEANYGERVEVLAIVLSDQRLAQRVWDMAKNDPTDAFFAQLAGQYSVEPASRANGGKVPPIRRHGGSPLIEEAAFKLQPGQLSGLVSVDNQHIIMRCLGRTKPEQIAYDDVKDLLVRDIQEKKLRALMTNEFDRLKATAQVDNFLAGTTQSGKLPRAGTLTPVGPTGAETGGPAVRPVPSGIAPAATARPATKTR
ncbi:MAG: peptidylprolyl isomerase [Planctomycetaceae bacterium]|nr:peptidylprolyl isomerase [Planctomycetaceae bacterium]